MLREVRGNACSLSMFLLLLEKPNFKNQCSFRFDHANRVSILITVRLQPHYQVDLGRLMHWGTGGATPRLIRQQNILNGNTKWLSNNQAND